MAPSELTARPTVGCQIKYMAKNSTISITQVQQNLKRVMRESPASQVLEVTRQRRPVARLSPLAEKTGPVSPWPNLQARARAVFGNREISPSGSTVVIEDRGER